MYILNKNYCKWKEGDLLIFITTSLTPCAEKIIGLLSLRDILDIINQFILCVASHMP